MVHEIFIHVFILQKSQSHCPYIHGFSYFLQQALISFHVLKILRPLISKLVLAFLIIYLTKHSQDYAQLKNWDYQQHNFPTLIFRFLGFLPDLTAKQSWINQRSDQITKIYSFTIVMGSSINLISWIQTAQVLFLKF